MGDASSKRPAVLELDGLFLEVFAALNNEVIRISAAAAEQVLKLSGGFLSEQAQKAATQFHSLYFGSSAVEKNKTDVNDDVDRLFEDIQGEVAKGATTQEISDAVTENLDRKADRLRLSAIQKELETLIRLDAGVKEKLMPVLTSMQFEDMVRQRLEHLGMAWEAVVSGIDDYDIADVELLSAEIEAKFSSTAEVALFYETVLKKPPPEGGLETGSVWLDF